MKRFPCIFVGHGSPMNAIEDNRFSRRWQELGRLLPKPRAILAVSAHWFTDGIRVMTSQRPKTIHDMYGFPPELYRITYPAPGSPDLASRVLALLGPEAKGEEDWGLDHGTWSVLRHMFPQADIPVIQLSIDWNRPPEEHFRIGRALADLRNESVLILGSGNIVHNLAKVRWDMPGGFDWADVFDEHCIRAMREGRFDDVVHYESAGSSARMAFYTPEHFLPLLYVLGAGSTRDVAEIFNSERMMGSISMTGVLLHDSQEKSKGKDDQ